MNLQSFTNTGLLLQVDRDLLTQVLQDSLQFLPPEAAPLLATPGPDHHEFCAACADLFRRAHTFGAPLRQALLAIETLVRPESQPLLDHALDQLPPGYEVSRTRPARHQALHLWLIASSVPGVSFPIPSVSAAGDDRLQAQPAEDQLSPSPPRPEPAFQHSEARLRTRPSAPQLLSSSAPSPPFTPRPAKTASAQPSS